MSGNWFMWILRVALVGGFCLLILPLTGEFWVLESEVAGFQSSYWMDVESRIPVDLSGSLLTPSGIEVELSDFQDRVLLLNFWATWCGPCLAEMPSMAELHEDLVDDGVSIVAVTDEPPEIVNAFLERNPYPFTILVDREGQLAGRLKIWSIPWTLVFDKNGKLAHFHQGARLWNTPDVKTNIERLLSE